jgi:hypothetical protein
MVYELPQFFNFDLYASEQTYAGLSEWKGRDMLRLSKSSIMQSNSLIDKAGTHKVYTGSVENDDGSYTDTYEEVADTLYLSVRFFVSVSGKLEFGFVENGNFIDNSFHYSSNVTAREDGYEVKLSGIWDGKGDFTITSTGDVYIDLLSLTDKPLDNFKITTETKIEQDATRISLLGKKINGVEGSVTDLGIELNAAEERITAYVNKEIQGVKSSVSSLEVGVEGIRTTVASVQGTATDAKNLANAAQSAANDAASKALAAQTTANSANSKADANATAIAQTESSISLLAGAFTLKDGKYVLTSAAGAVITSEVASIYATNTRVDGISGRVSTAESSISTMAGQIALKANQSSVDSLGNRVTTAEASIKVNADNINLKVSKNGIVAAINASPETITISASKIDLEGKVTFSMLDSNAQSTINSKVTQSAVDSSINTFKGTIIEGGKIKTELLEVTEIYATKGTVGGLTIEENNLHVTGSILTGLKDMVYTNTLSVEGLKIKDASNEISVNVGLRNIQFEDSTWLTSLSVENNQLAANRRSGDMCAVYLKTTKNDISLLAEGGNTLLRPVDGCFSSVFGLAVSSTATSGSPKSNMDFIRMTGNLTLPSPSSMKGKVYWIKCNDSYTLSVPQCVRCTSAYSSSPGTATWNNDDTRAFISDGVVWYEFYTGT